MLVGNALQYEDTNAFCFGDNENLSCHLLDLVRRGKKTATCTALRDIEEGRASMPEVGRWDTALKWDRTPALVIETTEVTIRRFMDVDYDFAIAEGENLTLEGWRADHEVYFARNGGFSETMYLVCERFRLVRDFRT